MAGPPGSARAFRSAPKLLDKAIQFPVSPNPAPNPNPPGSNPKLELIQGEKWLHLPINRNITPAEFISYLRTLTRDGLRTALANPAGPDALVRVSGPQQVGAESGDTAMERCHLHLDLAAPVSGAVSKLMFDLIYLGGVVEYRTGAVFSWDRSSTSISVEVASGPTLKRLPLCTILPRAAIPTAREAFTLESDALRDGMTTDEFAGWRYDGSSQHANSSAPNRVKNATQRGLYVCDALQIASKQAGFPFLFDLEATDSSLDMPTATFSSSDDKLFWS